MKKYLILGAVAAMVSACTEKPTTTIDMVCGDHEIKVETSRDHIYATVGEHRVQLNRTESASGEKYEASGEMFAGVVLWNKGEAWILIESEDATPIECVVKASGKINDIKVQGIEGTNVPTPTLP